MGKHTLALMGKYPHYGGHAQRVRSLHRRVSQILRSGRYQTCHAGRVCPRRQHPVRSPRCWRSVPPENNGPGSRVHGRSSARTPQGSSQKACCLMFAIRIPSLAVVSSHHPRKSVKNPANSSITSLSRPREWWRDLLWAAFPSASAHEVSKKAAPALGVSRRQVLNWLECEHDPKLGHVAKVLLIAGAEMAFRKLEGPRE